MIDRDDYRSDLDALLSHYQTSAFRTFEREAAENAAHTENAVREFALNQALLDRQPPRPLTRSLL